MFIIFLFFSYFFELVRTDAAQGALIILRQLVTFVDVITDRTYELFHTASPFLFTQAWHFPTNVS